MEAKIQEVEQYFRGKITSGEYEIGEITEFRCSLLIDGKYNFHMWISNGQRSYTVSDILTPSYMFFTLTSEEQEKAWPLIEPQIEKYRKEVVLEKKKRQYEALKKELNIE